MKTMTTLDNGGIPFSITTRELEEEGGRSKADVHAFDGSFTYSEMFDGTYGEGQGKNSAALFLLNVSEQAEHDGGGTFYLYRFIGTRIYDFTTNERIEEFYAQIGNAGVPYPVALSESKVYFMLDEVYVPKGRFEDFSDWPNAYGYFYGHLEGQTGPIEEEYKTDLEAQLMADRVL